MSEKKNKNYFFLKKTPVFFSTLVEENDSTTGVGNNLNMIQRIANWRMKTSIRKSKITFCNNSV